MIEALLSALATVLTGVHILYLFTGVFLGLLIGIFPGLGGIVGLSMLLPFSCTAWTPLRRWPCSSAWSRSFQPRTRSPRC